jgi:hypothetical protein
MSLEIDSLLYYKDYEKAINLCSKFPYLGLIISSINNLSYDFKNNKDIIRIKLLCNWTDSTSLVNLWKKMDDNRNILLVDSEPCDYYVVINDTQEHYLPEKTFLFHMEPNMKEPEKKYLKVFSHDRDYNNIEWHLSKTYYELSTQPILKDDSISDVISTVLSSKYRDPGQQLRIDFIKFIDRKMTVHVYGDNKFHYNNFRGSLPYHCKDNAILPYKYIFNAENHEIHNYFTEKIIDGILGESLVFYWGCPNIEKYIDSRAFVKLDLVNFQEDFEKIQKAIKEDWWSQRLPYIKAEKHRILNQLQFYPRLQKIINDIRNKESK